MYCDDLRSFFHSSSQEEYDCLLQEKRKIWDSIFEAYYMKEIHPEVSNLLGRWFLEKYSIYNPYSGVTNNQSES